MDRVRLGIDWSEISEPWWILFAFIGSRYKPKNNGTSAFCSICFTVKTKSTEIRLVDWNVAGRLEYGKSAPFPMVEKLEDAPFHIVPSHIREGICDPNINIPVIECIEAEYVV